MKLAPCLLAIALSVACESSHDPELMDAGPDSVVLDAATVDAGPGTFPAARALQTQGSCERIAGYELDSSEEPALIWSKAHAFVRAFGDHSSPWAIDAHLVAAISDDLRDGVVTAAPAAFGTYAELVPATCYAGVWGLPDAVYETTSEDIQWMRPGVPVRVTDANVILDLRDVPEGPSLDAFLASFAEEALGSIGSVAARYRSFSGLPDEGFLEQLSPGAVSTYRGRVTNGILTPIEGSSDSDARIGILLGERVAPSAARFALALRLDRRAAILGESLPVHVAERMVTPAAEGGLFTRVFELIGDESLPDVIDADIGSDDPRIIEEAFLALDIASLDAVRGESSRGEFRDIVQTNRVIETDRGEASRQAALITLHGVTQRFFPYWDVIDSDPDQRLMEALAIEAREEVEEEYGVEQEEYLHHIRSLRYLSNALMDSHVNPFFAAGGAPAPDFGDFASSRLPIELDHTSEGMPVVRFSESPDFQVGDVIEAIEGRPVLELINSSLEYSSSSDSSRMRNGLNTIMWINSPLTYQLRSAEGTVRDVEVTPVPDTPFVSRPSRARGPLDDIGHPELFYVDLAADATAGINSTALHRELRSYEGLVLDMRGYPGPGSWAFIAGLMNEGGPGPRLQEVLQGPETIRVRDIPQPTAAGTGFDGPVMILSAPTTQSQAEHLILTLTAAERVEVVGRPSAGANGTITSVALPGGFGISFTGLIILQNDESVFHGVGVPVDHPVEIRPEDLAAGIDPELQHAAELLAL